MPANGDHPSDSPPEYPMGIKPPAEEITEPDLRSAKEILRSLFSEVVQMRKEFREFRENVESRVERVEAQVILIPKRGEQ